MYIYIYIYMIAFYLEVVDSLYPASYLLVVKIHDFIHAPISNMFFYLISDANH